MNVVYKIILDVQHPTRTNRIAIKQRDHKSRTLQFTLLNNGAALDMTSVLYATIKGVKPDGESVIYADAEIAQEDGVNTNVVKYVIDDSFVETAGRYTMELQLLDSESTVLSSFEFYIEIQNQLYDEDDYVTESDLSGFRSYMIRNLNATEKSESIENKFESAYGSIESVVNDLTEIKEEYADMMADLEEKVDTGYFIGARGPQGENGADAVVTELEGLFALQIVGADLVLQYGSTAPPALAIVGDELVWTWEE